MRFTASSPVCISREDYVTVPFLHHSRCMTVLFLCHSRLHTATVYVKCYNMLKCAKICYVTVPAINGLLVTTGNLYLKLSISLITSFFIVSCPNFRSYCFLLFFCLLSISIYLMVINFLIFSLETEYKLLEHFVVYLQRKKLYIQNT